MSRRVIDQLRKYYPGTWTYMPLDLYPWHRADGMKVRCFADIYSDAHHYRDHRGEPVFLLTDLSLKGLNAKV